jgi:predicted permease
MGWLRDDLRVALRRCRHQPGFTLVVVLTLALGLGANTAVFSLIDALMLRSLPVERPDELYRLGETTNCCVNSGLQQSWSLYSSGLFEHLRQTTPEFSDLAGFQANLLTLGVRRSGSSVPESLPGQFVTGNYFRVFGVKPAAGRLLQPDDDRSGAPPVVVLSYRAWSRFGFDPSLIGGAVALDGQTMTVVGVTAPEFFGDTIRPDPAAVWIPMNQEPVMRGDASLINHDDQQWLYAIGRLRAGLTIATVSAHVTTSLQQWLGAQSYLSNDDRRQLPHQQIVVTPAGSGVPALQSRFSQSLLLMFLTSAVLLLIACANLANLLLARADRGQAAIRAALGASSRRLMRQSMVEGIVLALAGALAGVLVAVVGTRALITLAFPPGAYVPVDAAPSVSVLLFSIALAIITGVLFTVAPAWAMSKAAPLDALSSVGRSVQQRSLVPRRSLVITQVALSFVMLTSAGLLVGSLRNLEHQPLGFDPSDRVVIRMDPPASERQPERLARLYEALRDRLSRVPGVVSVSYSLSSPMDGNNWSSGITIAGRPTDTARPDSSSWNRIGPNYFATVGTRLVRGRAFDERDVPGAPRVAVVNEAFVRRFLESSDPIGRTVGIGGVDHSGDFEIVGVVEDVKYAFVTQPVRPMLFVSGFQSGTYDDSSSRNVQLRSMVLRSIVVRTHPDAGNVEGSLRAAVAEVNANVNVIRVLPMALQVSGNFSVQRLTSRLTSLYGALALILTALGLYGVTAYGVARRTREIGVRMALGAGRSGIMRTVGGGPVIETAVGLAIGVPLAALAGRALQSQLFDLGAQNPAVWGAVVAILLATAFVAAAIPARRAASIDPARALRGD